MIGCALTLQDCCQLVEDALERFPKDANVQTQGCRAVTNLFNGEANIEKARDNSRLQVLRPSGRELG